MWLTRTMREVFARMSISSVNFAQTNSYQAKTPLAVEGASKESEAPVWTSESVSLGQSVESAPSFSKMQAALKEERGSVEPEPTLKERLTDYVDEHTSKLTDSAMKAGKIGAKLGRLATVGLLGGGIGVLLGAGSVLKEALPMLGAGVLGALDSLQGKGGKD